MLPRQEALALVQRAGRSEHARVECLLVLWEQQRRATLTALVQHSSGSALRRFALVLAHDNCQDGAEGLCWLRTLGGKAWAAPFADVRVLPPKVWMQELH